MSVGLPLVSVVTPSYNAAPHIAETIESVCRQSYPHIQHIVVDGGSTDGTVGILNSYPHLEWISEPDGGQSQALNKGFRRAQGKIVGWLNADDLYTPGTIGVAVEYLERHPEVAAVYGDCRVIDDTGECVQFARSEPFDLERLLLENYISQPTVFVRRQALMAAGGVSDDLCYVMDWDLWIRIGAASAMHYLSGQTMASFRRCVGTKSVEHPSEFDLEWLRVLDRVSEEPAFANIPPRTKRLARRKAWARHYMTRVYAARSEQDWSAVRYCLLRALFYDPSWMSNLGTWSIALRALVGESLVGSIKRVLGLRLCVF